MKGTVDFKYDPKTNIVFEKDNWEIWTNQDVDEFLGEVKRFLASIGKKVYVIGHIDGLLIHAAATEYYGEMVRQLAKTYLYGFVRWGTNNRARMTVRTTSSKVNTPANIYTTLDEAIKAIEEMKKNQEAK